MTAVLLLLRLLWQPLPQAPACPRAYPRPCLLLTGEWGCMRRGSCPSFTAVRP